MYVCVHTHIETKKLIYYNHSKVKFLISRYNDQKKENGWEKIHLFLGLRPWFNKMALSKK